MAGTRRFSVIKAHLCPRRLSHLTLSPGHAGAGGGPRNWAINRWMSLNTLRGTATFGHLERNVTPVANHFGADLDQLLAQTGQGP